MYIYFRQNKDTTFTIIYRYEYIPFSRVRARARRVQSRRCKLHVRTLRVVVLVSSLNSTLIVCCLHQSTETKHWSSRSFFLLLLNSFFLRLTYSLVHGLVVVRTVACKLGNQVCAILFVCLFFFFFSPTPGKRFHESKLFLRFVFLHFGTVVV